MKKVLLLYLFLFLSSFVVYSQDENNMVYRMSSPIINEKCTFENDSVEIHFFIIDNDYMHEFCCSVTNKTSERIYIEWENARLAGGKVVFGTDTRLSMRNQKSDEAIAKGKSSQTQNILSQNWVHSDFISTPFKSSWIKDVSMNKEGRRSFDVLIPIKYSDGKVVDYDFVIDVISVNPADISKINVGMTSKQVKKLLGKPDTDFDEGNLVVWKYLNKALVFFDNKVVSKIETIAL